MVEFIQVGNEVLVMKDSVKIGKIIPVKKGTTFVYKSIPVNGSVSEWSSMEVAQLWYA